MKNLAPLLLALTACAGSGTGDPSPDPTAPDAGPPVLTANKTGPDAAPDLDVEASLAQDAAPDVAPTVDGSPDVEASDGGLWVFIAAAPPAAEWFPEGDSGCILVLGLENMNGHGGWLVCDGDGY